MSCACPESAHLLEWYPCLERVCLTRGPRIPAVSRGCAPKSPMLRNARLWGRTGPRAHLREAESSRIPRFGDGREASPRAFGAF